MRWRETASRLFPPRLSSCIGRLRRHRRFVACLHADISGYSRLIAGDVEATVRTLTAYRAVIRRVVAKHRGRVVDVAGDSFLAQFPSAVGAVQCALEVQRELAARNAVLPADRRLEFRVGIDVGHVLVDSGRIYGDCVNIAARVQEVAPPGGICVAGSAYDCITPATPLRLDYLGERQAKNIERPVRIYQVAGRESSVV